MQGESYVGWIPSAVAHRLGKAINALWRDPFVRLAAAIILAAVVIGTGIQHDRVLLYPAFISPPILSAPFLRLARMAYRYVIPLQQVPGSGRLHATGLSNGIRRGIQALNFAHGVVVLRGFNPGHRRKLSGCI